VDARSAHAERIELCADCRTQSRRRAPPFAAELTRRRRGATQGARMLCLDGFTGGDLIAQFVELGATHSEIISDAFHAAAMAPLELR
jgi:hypothetical protein